MSPTPYLRGKVTVTSHQSTGSEHVEAAHRRWQTSSQLVVRQLGSEIALRLGALTLLYKTRIHSHTRCQGIFHWWMSGTAMHWSSRLQGCTYNNFHPSVQRQCQFLLKWSTYWATFDSSFLLLVQPVPPTLPAGDLAPSSVRDQGVFVGLSWSIRFDQFVLVFLFKIHFICFFF